MARVVAELQERRDEAGEIFLTGKISGTRVVVRRSRKTRVDDAGRAVPIWVVLLDEPARERRELAAGSIDRH